MANLRGKTVDTTFLSLDMARERGFIHRDYLAHCFRWTHVAKFMHQAGRYKTAHLLDVGCGREAPLPKLLFASRLTHTTGSYTGVDYGPCERPSTISDTTDKFNATFLPKTDFVKAKLPRDKYDVITSFEVLEHVEPFHSYSMLKRMRSLMHTGSTAFISTPCYEAATGAAANHVNEMSYVALEAMIKLAGLRISTVYGTFASQKDYKKLLSPNDRAMFDKLGEYYDSNVLACIFAPLFPAESRNCLWVLNYAAKPELPTVKGLDAALHSNSAEWSSHWARIIADAKKEMRK